MWNYKHSVKQRVVKQVGLVLALFSCLSAVWVIACGPDFPTQTLSDRRQTLRGTPVNSFAWEVAHLVQADDNLRANNQILNDPMDNDPMDNDPMDNDPMNNAQMDHGSADANAAPRQTALNALETEGLTAEQALQLTRMRQAGSGDEAYALGEGLPEAVRLYTAAAMQYRNRTASSCHATEHATEQLTAKEPTCQQDNVQADARMLERFQAVLDLPAQQGQSRAVWAAFMLGKIHASAVFNSGQNEEVPNQKALTQAKHYFALTRELARRGDYDPESLGVASYGEEARMYLASKGSGLCDPNDLAGVNTPAAWSDLPSDQFKAKYAAWRVAPLACYKDIPADNFKKAIALYAQQTARGGDATSLALLADYFRYHPQLISQLVDDPLTQRLLVAYVLNYVVDVGRIDQGLSHDDPKGDYRFVECDAYFRCDAALGQPQVHVAPVLATLITAIEQQHGVNHSANDNAGADRLAALAYRTGHYDVAARLVAQIQSPLSSWVRAKLALQRGDLAAAAQAYADAAQAFPQISADVLPVSRTNRLRGEQATLALARGEYVQAFGFFVDVAQKKEREGGDLYSNPYLFDASYLAERVFTTAELQAFVDAHLPASQPYQRVGPPQEDEYRVETPVADTLRYVLARRLMREKHYQAALPYFPVAGDQRFHDPQVAEHARHYIQLLRDIDNAWTNIGKAKALMQAAKILRQQGMELIGYEQEPDFRFSDGNYSCCAGHLANEILDKTDKLAAAVMPENLWTLEAAPMQDITLPRNEYVTKGEQTRFLASMAQPLRQFHYRYLAAELAAQAADQLPPRSQAYAAALCQAYVWTRDRDSDLADAYYQRYIDNGAQIDWAFASPCPEPDYAGAQRRARLDGWHAVVTHIRQVIPWRLRYSALLVLCGLALLLWGGVQGYRKFKATDKDSDKSS